jgi:hypothetical protein
MSGSSARRGSSPPTKGREGSQRDTKTVRLHGHDPDVDRPPSDFALLREIYKRHSEDYRAYADEGPVIPVPIDIPGIASKFGVDPNSVFGRLYFHLDPKYGQPKEASGGPRKALFFPGEEQDFVNFPLLEAVLAGLWQERNRNLWAIGIALASLVFSLSSIIVSIVVAATA